MEKKTCLFFTPKPLKMWGKKEQVNLRRLADFQIGCLIYISYSQTKKTL